MMQGSRLIHAQQSRLVRPPGCSGLLLDCCLAERRSHVFHPKLDYVSTTRDLLSSCAKVIAGMQSDCLPLQLSLLRWAILVAKHRGPHTRPLATPLDSVQRIRSHNRSLSIKTSSSNIAFHPMQEAQLQRRYVISAIVRVGIGGLRRVPRSCKGSLFRGKRIVLYNELFWKAWPSQQLAISHTLDLLPQHREYGARLAQAGKCS